MWLMFSEQLNALQKNYFLCSNSFAIRMIEEFELVKSLKRLNDFAIWWKFCHHLTMNFSLIRYSPILNFGNKKIRYFANAWNGTFSLAKSFLNQGNIHLWHPHGRGDGGGRVLKFVTCLQILLFLNIDLLLLWAEGGGMETKFGGSQNCFFIVDVMHELWP